MGNNYRVQVPNGTKQLEAQEMRVALDERLLECGLELHPERTKIVYCKDDERRENFPVTKLDYLGYTFQCRRSKNRWGKYIADVIFLLDFKRKD